MASKLSVCLIDNFNLDLRNTQLVITPFDVSLRILDIFLNTQTLEFFHLVFDLQKKRLDSQNTVLRLSKLGIVAPIHLDLDLGHNSFLTVIEHSLNVVIREFLNRPICIRKLIELMHI